jgi:hypothetical protein
MVIRSNFTDNDELQASTHIQHHNDVATLAAAVTGAVLRAGDTMTGPLGVTTLNASGLITAAVGILAKGATPLRLANAANNDGYTFGQFDTNGWQFSPITATGDRIRYNTTVEIEGNELKINSVGKGFRLKEGASARMGVATLVGGSAVVTSTNVVSATSRIFLTVQSLGTVTAPKAVAVTARTANVSFTITSSDVTDTSVVAYLIVEPT